jgi:hypothetical protein
MYKKHWRIQKTSADGKTRHTQNLWRMVKTLLLLNYLLALIGGTFKWFFRIYNIKIGLLVFNDCYKGISIYLAEIIWKK